MALARTASSSKAQARAAPTKQVALRPCAAVKSTSVVATPARAAFAPAQVSQLPQRAVTLRAAAAPSAPSTSADASTSQTWYALVANAEFMLNDVQNESMAEQLRERMRFFREQGLEADFFLVPNPKWLDEKYPAQAKQVARPCVALVSSDKYWIVFMKLRLDRVMKFDLVNMSKAEVLASAGDLPEFTKPMAGAEKKWTAPYGRYAPGWWKVFFPNQA